MCGKKRVKKAASKLISLILVSHFSITAVSAQSSDQSSQHEQEVQILSNQILAAQLDLLQLGLELKRRGESKKIGRERRFTCYALANSCLTSVGAFMAGAGRLRYASNPTEAPEQLFENATIVRVIANAVSASGVVLEVGKDTVDSMIDKRLKLNLGSVEKEAERLQQEISLLSSRRLIAVASIEDQAQKKLHQFEQAVLDDVHEAVLDELAAFYAETKGNRASRIVQLTSTGISNTVSGLGSLYSGIIVPRVYRDDPVKSVRYGGVGGITDVTTGSLNAATPLLALGANIVSRRDSKAVLFKQIGAQDFKNYIELRRHENTLQSMLKASECANLQSFRPRRNAIAQVIEILENHREISDKERRKVIRQLFVNILDSGADASGSFSKIVNGTGTLVGAYRYTFDDKKRFRVTGATGIAYGIGNAIAVEEVARDMLTREIRRKRQRRQHQLLSQIMDDEISALRKARNDIRLRL